MDFDATLIITDPELENPARFLVPETARTVLFDYRATSHLRPEDLVALQRINTRARVAVRVSPDSQPHRLFTRLGLFCKPDSQESPESEGFYWILPAFRVRAIN